MKYRHIPTRLVVTALIALAGISVSLLACGSGATTNDSSVGGNAQEVNADTLATLFAKPEIPLMIKDPHQKALYFLDHYWDEFDFERGEEILSNQKDLLEQSFVDFLGVALSLPLDEASPFLTRPAESASGELSLYFEDLYHRYLYEAGSPLVSEDYYIPVLEWYTTSPKANIATQERSKMLLRLVKKNRVGSPAEDFAFTLDNGETRRLRNFRGKPTILFFFTPGCEGCKISTEILSSDDYLMKLVARGAIHLLYIYAEDDLKAFKAALSQLPSGATAGVNSDHSIVSIPLYDLKASPTIYLLDEKGYVLLKDVDIPTISRFLAQNDK